MDKESGVKGGGEWRRGRRRKGEREDESGVEGGGGWGIGTGREVGVGGARREGDRQE